MMMVAPEAAAQPFLFRVSDLRQHLWCPRIPFYSYVLPVDRKVTVKMEIGTQSHVRLEALERRRTLRRYHLKEGERLFRVPLSSSRLRLQGIVDLILRTPHEIIPVEFKAMGATPALHHKYQLAAYGMLAEERFHRTVRRGFLYMMEAQEIVPVELSEGVRRYVRMLVQRLEVMSATQHMPEATAHRERCRDCEFRHYCADIY